MTRKPDTHERPGYPRSETDGERPAIEACPPSDAVAAFIDGHLPFAERAAFERHVDRCPDCSALLAAYGREFMSADTMIAGPQATARRELSAGARVGRYVVRRTIASGGMGIVYLASDPEMDRSVALKLVRPGGHGPADDEARRRLLAEARALAKLAHPNVVAAYDVGAFGEEIYVAMEHVEGMPLSTWLGVAPRTRAEVLRVFREAASGLQAVHRAGFVHRDFKPSNVLVGADGRVRLLDFGLAQLPAAGVGRPSATMPMELSEAPAAALTLVQTRAGALLGTPAYMSPEQFRGATVDAQSDQFSFCVALHEALCGGLPFGGATLGELRERVLAGRREPSPGFARLPGWLRKVLARGLAVERDRRFPSMQALAAALTPPPTWPRLVGGLALALGIGAGGAVAVIAATARPRQASEPGASSSSDNPATAATSGSAPADGSAETGSQRPSPDGGGERGDAGSGGTDAPDAGSAAACGRFPKDSSDPCLRCITQACCPEATRCSESDHCYGCAIDAEACDDDMAFAAFARCASDACEADAGPCGDDEKPSSHGDDRLCSATGAYESCRSGECRELRVEAEARGPTAAKAEAAAAELCTQRLAARMALELMGSTTRQTAPCKVTRCGEP